MSKSETEYNDTFETADELSLDNTISGQLLSSDDIDAYAISVDSAGSLSVSFDVPTNSSYSDYFGLGFYDSTGTLLAYYGVNDAAITRLFAAPRTFTINEPAAQ